MGRQWNTIIDALSGGTMAINVNVADIEALLVTLQADVADGIRLPNATTGGTGPRDFTSTSYGTIATSSTARLGCTIFNEGAGRLYLTLGTQTTSTTSYTASVGSGEYYEVPMNYTGLIGGILGSAGTAKVTVLS